MQVKLKWLKIIVHIYHPLCPPPLLTSQRIYWLLPPHCLVLSVGEASPFCSLNRNKKSSKISLDEFFRFRYIQICKYTVWLCGYANTEMSNAVGAGIRPQRSGLVKQFLMSGGNYNNFQILAVSKKKNFFRISYKIT